MSLNVFNPKVVSSYPDNIQRGGKNMNMLYQNSSSESNYFRPVTYKNLDDDKIMKLCEISDVKGLTREDLQNEFTVAQLASEIEVGPKVYESQVLDEYAYIIMDRMQYSLKEVINMIDIGFKPRQGGCPTDSSQNSTSLKNFVACNPVLFLKNLLEQGVFRTIFILFQKLGKNGYFHMDLRPENVFLNFEFKNGVFQASKVRLIDFGITLQNLGEEKLLSEGLVYEDNNGSNTFYNERQIFKKSSIDIRKELEVTYPEWKDEKSLNLRSEASKQLFGAYIIADSLEGTLVRLKSCIKEHGLYNSDDEKMKELEEAYKYWTDKKETKIAPARNKEIIDLIESNSKGETRKIWKIMITTYHAKDFINFCNTHSDGNNNNMVLLFLNSNKAIKDSFNYVLNKCYNMETTIQINRENGRKWRKEYN